MENSTPRPNASMRISTCLVIVFAASSIFYALVFRSGSLEAGEVIHGLPLTWTFVLAALVTTIVFQRNLHGLGWGFSKQKYYLDS